MILCAEMGGTHNGTWFCIIYNYKWASGKEIERERERVTDRERETDR